MLNDNDVDMLGRKYSNSLLLFIGEGNFSFSASLSASEQFSLLNCDLIATDFVPELKEELEKEEAHLAQEEPPPKEKAKFNLALLKDNLATLRLHKCSILLDVDASKLHEHDELLSLTESASGRGKSSKLFVIFNFPHVKSKKMKIGLNRDLLRLFFLSCEKLHEKLNSSSKTNEMEVIPVVSLCAGQSGIPEVESVTRSWGDSWQINDMAAHGNFVCGSISNFEEWDLFQLSVASDARYQSSYYRLQTGVGFTWKDGLTLSFQRRPAIDPNDSSRLSTSILKFASENCQDEIVTGFRETFENILEEKVEASCKELKVSADKRPYLHSVTVCSGDVVENILKYLNDLSRFKVRAEQEEGQSWVALYVEVLPKPGEKAESDSELLQVLVGKLSTDNLSSHLYVDKLLELKYDQDYRILLSSLGKSLFPRVHEFHISFWLEEAKLTMNSFMVVLLDVYGLMLKSVETVEEYQDKTRRKSVCWRIQVQSLDLPLSRHMAHQINLRLREELGSRLKVEVR